jgi:hypothetical protein
MLIRIAGSVRTCFNFQIFLVLASDIFLKGGILLSKRIDEWSRVHFARYVKQEEDGRTELLY